MSDFLARESELLGGSFSEVTPGLSSSAKPEDIDLDAAASAFPDLDLDGDISSLPAISAPSAPPADTFSFDAFSPVPKSSGRTDVKVTGDDEIEKFESNFPDIGSPEPDVFSPPVVQQPSFGVSAPFAPRPQPSTFTSTPILQQTIPDEDEPEVIRQWRERQAEEIKAREDGYAQKRQEIISKAERSIDQFYEEYNVKKEKNIKENKEQELDYLASLSESLSSGTTWSRICELVDLQNSQSKTTARAGAGTTELSRFKEVLLRLKREGDTAPGAAGY